MITLDLACHYKFTYGVWTDCGWHYGPATIEAVHTGPVHYWWGVCPACGEPAMCTLNELQRPTDCRKSGCGALSNDSYDWSQYDWTVDRHMVSLSLEQEAFTAAWILGGPEAVRAAAKAKHLERLAAVAIYKEKVKRPGSVIEPKGADDQET